MKHRRERGEGYSLGQTGEIGFETMERTGDGKTGRRTGGNTRMFRETEEREKEGESQER